MKTLDLGWNPDFSHSEIHLDDNDEMHFTETQPGEVLEAIMDNNHELAREGANPIAQGRHVASVPTSEYYRWNAEYEKVKHLISRQAFMVAKLNDPNFKRFLVHARSGGIVAKV